jgi:uncharacterized protein YfaQ (DUF2300 family)
VGKPAVIYTPRPDATPEAKSNVLVNVYAYLIKTHDSKRAAEPDQPCAGDSTSSIPRKEGGMT